MLSMFDFRLASWTLLRVKRLLSSCFLAVKLSLCGFWIDISRSNLDRSFSNLDENTMNVYKMRQRFKKDSLATVCLTSRSAQLDPSFVVLNESYAPNRFPVDPVWPFCVEFPSARGTR